MADTRKITDASIEVSWGRATLTVTLEDGHTEKLFGWYIDELSFTASGFVGMTVAEACKLRHDRDVAYLQS